MRRIAWIFFLCIILVGCDKNNAVIPVEPPPVTAVQPKVVLSITPESVVLPYGSKVIINWSATDANLCVLNNETVQVAGTREAQLFVDTRYSIMAVYGVVSSAPVEKSIKVGDWTTSKLGLLTYDGQPWMTKYIRVFQDGKMVSNSELSQFDKTTMYYFTLDGHIKVVEASGATNTSGKWSFSNNETNFVNGEVYLIEKLTKDEFVFSISTNYNGKPATSQLTYYRPVAQ